MASFSSLCFSKSIFWFPIGEMVTVFFIDLSKPFGKSISVAAFAGVAGDCDWVDFSR